MSIMFKSPKNFSESIFVLADIFKEGTLYLRERENLYDKKGWALERAVTWNSGTKEKLASGGAGHRVLQFLFTMIMKLLFFILCH